MSYTPTNWATGDVITAEKLNNIEEGIVNASEGVAIFSFTIDGNDEVTTDTTVQEVLDTLQSGKLCVANITQETAGGPSVFVDLFYTGFGRAYVEGENFVVKTGSITMNRVLLIGNAQIGWSCSVDTYDIAIS